VSKTEVIYYYTEEDVNRLARRIAVRMSSESIALGFFLGLFVGVTFDVFVSLAGLT
jgi:hypothetical protein